MDIVVQDLRKTYLDGTEAVRGVSFTVAKGEIFGLLGPNGAGKTTTMRILGTLHPATSGRATVLGLDVAKHRDKVRKRIGFAMQEVGMDDLATAREMLILHGRLYGLDRQEASTRAQAMLESFGLADHAERRVRRFSGGMQRRLDLAVSILHEPEVLFLDEPSTGLDPTSRAELWTTLRRLQKKNDLTIVMSTHYMEEAEALCDRIAIMDGGRIAAIDTPEKLRRSVGQERVRVRFARALNQKESKRVASAFRGKGQVKDDVLEVPVRDGRQVMDVLQRIHDLGLDAVSTRVVEPSLDDVFLRYTGASLKQTDPGKADPQPSTAGTALGAASGLRRRR